MIPTHQGRAAERILFTVMCKPGHVVPNNTHFDTTRANIEFTGARAVDLPLPAAADTQAPIPFKGNMDVMALERLIAREGAEKIPLVMLTVTNNSGGGQPVSMANIEAVREMSATYKSRSISTPAGSPKTPGSSSRTEPGFADWSPKRIAQEMFSYADGCTFSAKKDAFANIGGFLCTNDDRLAQQESNLLILTEGFPTYGGLAGRDLEAIAVGPRRGARSGLLAIPYRVHRLSRPAHRRPRRAHRRAARRPRHLHRRRPHAAAYSAAQFPGQSLAVELYRHAGVRSVEIGSVMFGEHAQHELLRLAIPRRVYTQSHIDYLVEAILEVNARKSAIRGLEIVEEPPFLRHFTARLRPVTTDVNQ